jgi:hypothetical protein
MATLWVVLIVRGMAASIVNNKNYALVVLVPDWKMSRLMLPIFRMKLPIFFCNECYYWFEFDLRKAIRFLVGVYSHISVIPILVA